MLSLASYIILKCILRWISPSLIGHEKSISQVFIGNSVRLIKMSRHERDYIIKVSLSWSLLVNELPLNLSLSRDSHF